MQVSLIKLANIVRIEAFMEMRLPVQTISFSFILCLLMFAYIKHGVVYTRTSPTHQSDHTIASDFFGHSKDVDRTS